MEGTSLKKMFEYLDGARENQAQMQRVVTRFTETQAALTMEYNAHVKQLNKLHKMQSAEEDLEKVNQEKYWCKVRNKELEIEDLKQQITELEEQIEEWDKEMKGKADEVKLA